jgi:hypothetical protein
VSRPLLVALASLLIGVALGFLAWGGPALRAEQDLVRDLGAVTLRLEEHERLLASMVAEREAKSSAALAECEQAQEKIAKELESCLFERAGNSPPPGDPRPRSGTSSFSESLDYPIPIPPRPQ